VNNKGKERFQIKSVVKVGQAWWGGNTGVCKNLCFVAAGVRPVGGLGCIVGCQAELRHEGVHNDRWHRWQIEGTSLTGHATCLITQPDGDQMALRSFSHWALP
jgi:hypothetical protein